MIAQKLFQELVKDDVAPLLKTHGFKKKGMNFGLRGTDVWGLLTFRRDEYNTADDVSFTITINVACDKLRDLNGWPFDPKAVPSSDLPTVQWYADIGDFMIGKRQSRAYCRYRLGKNEWWRLRTIDDFERVCPAVVAALTDVAIPELRKRRSLDAITEVYLTTGDDRVLGSTRNLAYALWFQGHEDEARKLLRQELRELERERRHALPYFKRALAKLGIDPDTL
jgi:hypothetical protein